MNWEQMTERERDVWIAENLFGFERYYGCDHTDGRRDPSSPYCLIGTPEYLANWASKFGPSEEPNGSPPLDCDIPEFTTVASDDYLVLEHVREGSVSIDADRFSSHLTRTWSKRLELSHNFNAAMYKPGDYSHAAYLAMQEGEVKA